MNRTVKSPSLYWLLSRKTGTKWNVTHCLLDNTPSSVPILMKVAKANAFNGSESREWEISVLEVNVPEMNVWDQMNFVMREIDEAFVNRTVLYAIKVTKE
jgi:hypothetical protein